MHVCLILLFGRNSPHMERYHLFRFNGSTEYFWVNWAQPIDSTGIWATVKNLE